MKRTVTVTFEFEDNEKLGGLERVHPPKAARKAMEIASCAFGSKEFSAVRLDGDLLVDKDGNAPDEVKLLPEYVRYMYLKK